MLKIEVIEIETEKVVHEVDCTGKGKRAADRVQRGLNRNLNHDKFQTRIAHLVGDNQS